jgi:hypothetical protein
MRFGQQPQYPSFNRGHPLAQGCVFACLPGVQMGFRPVGGVTNAVQKDAVRTREGLWNTATGLAVATWANGDAGRRASTEDNGGAGAKRSVYTSEGGRYDTPRSISAAVLMRPRTTYSGGQSFFSRATAFSAGNESWIIGAETGSQYYWQIADAAGGEDFVDSTTVQSATRTDLIVGTYDGANIRIYVNGKLEATAAATRTLANPAGLGIAFGPFTSGSELIIDYFMGATWKRALTPQEIGLLWADPYRMWRPSRAGRELGKAPAAAVGHIGNLFLSF